MQCPTDDNYAEKLNSAKLKIQSVIWPHVYISDLTEISSDMRRFLLLD